MHPWGDDQNQTIDPTMSFKNPAWDGKRGIRGDAYRDYVPPARLTALQSAVAVMHDAIWAVRGQDYLQQQGFDLYPTSGTSEDWAFTREFLLPARGELSGFVIEFNKNIDFFPTWGEMQKLIEDIDSGLIALCQHATPSFWVVIFCRFKDWFKTWFWALWHRVFPPELWGPYGPWSRIGAGVKGVLGRVAKIAASFIGRGGSC